MKAELEHLPPGSGLIRLFRDETMSSENYDNYDGVLTVAGGPVSTRHMLRTNWLWLKGLFVRPQGELIGACISGTHKDDPRGRKEMLGALKSINPLLKHRIGYGEVYRRRADGRKVKWNRQGRIRERS